MKQLILYTSTSLCNLYAYPVCCCISTLVQSKAPSTGLKEAYNFSSTALCRCKYLSWRTDLRKFDSSRISQNFWIFYIVAEVYSWTKLLHILCILGHSNILMDFCWPRHYFFGNLVMVRNAEWMISSWQLSSTFCL